MLFQSLRALCLAPEGPESIWNHLGAPVRSPGVPGRSACGFRRNLPCADMEALPERVQRYELGGHDRVDLQAVID